VWTIPTSFYSLIPNANSGAGTLICETYLGSTYIGGTTADFTFYVTNSNPVFESSQLTYQDTNSAVIAITENDQLIVQNQSNLQVTFTAATPLNSATISQYQVTFNGSTVNYHDAQTINYSLVNLSQNAVLQVKVVDSRGNSAAISVIIQMLGWSPPNITASAARINNFENETNLTANVSVFDVGGLNSLQTLKYKTQQIPGGTWSNPTDFPNNTPTQIVLDNLYAWNVSVTATDKFGESSTEMVVSKGMPIVFFDTQKLSVGAGCFPVNDNSLETVNFYTNGTTNLNGENMIFEDGVWAPNIASRSGTDPTFTKQYGDGKYKRINNLCFVTFYGKWSITNAGTDYACVTGLPFLSISGVSGQSLALHELYGAINRNPTRTGIIPDNSMVINLQGEDGSYACQWQTGDVWIGFSGVYLISA
jgi:hypothetical protein